jgi:hypothetical protein
MEKLVLVWTVMILIYLWLIIVILDCGFRVFRNSENFIAKEKDEVFGKNGNKVI